MIISSDWIVPVTSAPLWRHAVDIERGIIQEIRPARKDDHILENVCLMPGLINAHTHLAYTCFGNAFDHLEFFPWVRKLTEAKKNATQDQIEESTRQGIRECLRAGITTVADLSDMEVNLRVLGESPLRAIYYWEIFGVEKEQAAGSWDFLQNQFPMIRQKYQSDRLQIGVSPHSCYTVRPELFREIANWASAEKVPVSFHLAESEAEQQFIAERRGIIHDFLKIRAADWNIDAQSPVQHLEKTGIFAIKPLIAHAVHASDSDIDTLARFDVSVAHCPKSNAKFGHGVAPLQKFLRAGLRVGLGTDSAASNNRLDLFEEARFALFQQRALNRQVIFSEQQMLEMITISAANAMGLGDQIGSIEAGKKADLIAIKLSQKISEPSQLLNFLIYSCGVEDVIKTIIDGVEVQA
jgi:aminodeoxyfutalosine deaminase